MSQKKSKDYWEKRARENENKVYKQGTELVKELNSSYIRARREIQKSINDLVARYMDKTNLSYAEAVKNLSSSEFKEWRMGLEEYEKEIERLSKFSPTLSKLMRIELETLATKSQITRLDILKAQIDFELNKKGVTEQEVIEKGIGTVYKDFYKMYITEFGLTGINTVLPKGTIERLMQQPWSGANFSERIWSNREALGNTLKQEIIQSFIQGISVKDLSDRIQKRFDADRYNTERLVRTELNYALNETTKLSYKEAEIGEYEFLAEIDNRTSQQCRGLNGQKFKLKDAKVGVNYPPMHPHCRSTTIPVIDYENFGKKKLKKEPEKSDIIKEKVNDIRLGLLEKDLGEEYSKNIKNILNKSPEKIQKIWNKYSEQFKFISINHTGTANYSTFKDGVSLNLKKIITDETFDFKVGRGEEIYRKAYGTFFHEFGHNISSLISREKGVKYFDFSDIFESKKYINKKGKGYMLSEMLKEEANDILNKIKKERKILKNEACLVMKEELRKMTVLESGDISDIFAGCTNNKVIGFMGHRAEYWKRINVGVEAFAEMFDATVNNPSSLKRIKEYFPKSYDIFLEMLDEVEVE